MIDATHDLPITRQAELLEVSRSSVYYLPQPTSEGDLRLMRRIDELHHGALIEFRVFDNIIA